MKKHLWLGGALIAAGFASAQSAHACSHTITNLTGSPPVVVGSEVRFFANGWAPVLELQVDGHPYQIYDILDPGGTVFPASGGLPITTGYGNHTLWSNFDGCTINFTNVAPEPPPVKYDAPTLSDSGAGVACPVDVLTWTAVTGAATYELWQRQLAPALSPSMTQVWSTANRSKSVRVARNAQFVYAVRACGPDKSCSDLSNFQSVVGAICP